jgi:hypothetical protein
VFFINGGELYKGSQRFGANKVFTVPATGQDAEGYNLTSASAAAGATGMISGDILVGYGAAKVWDGSAWVDMGADNAALQSSWRSDISAWTVGLVQSGSGSYITGITQGADGKVTASASNFANDVKTAIGNSTVSGANNGVTVSVTTTSGKVTAVEVTAPAAKTWTGINVGDANSYIYNVTQGTDGQVSASAAAFPTLATGTSDGTVKLGSGADAKVSGWDTVKTDITNLKSVVSYSGSGDSVVTATTGSFTNLTVTDTATFSATTVSATTLTIGGSDISDLISTGADARISAAKLSGNIAASNGTGLVNEGQVVNYVSAQLSSFDNAMHFIDAGTTLPTSAKAGDVYVFTSDATDGSNYKAGQEVVYKGDNGTYSSANWEVIGDQNNYVTTAAFQTSWTTLGTAAFASTAATVTAGAETLPTGGAVASYVGSAISTAISGLDSTVSTSAGDNIKVSITEVDGKLTSVTATLEWITD